MFSSLFHAISRGFHHQQSVCPHRWKYLLCDHNKPFGRNNSITLTTGTEWHGAIMKLDEEWQNVWVALRTCLAFTLLSFCCVKHKCVLGHIEGPPILSWRPLTRYKFLMKYFFTESFVATATILILTGTHWLIFFYFFFQMGKIYFHSRAVRGAFIRSAPAASALSLFHQQTHTHAQARHICIVTLAKRNIIRSSQNIKVNTRVLAYRAA